MSILHYPTVDSTNHLAMVAATEGAVHGTVIWADEQTAGRGQYDRSFYSPPGGLYFSIIVRPQLETSRFSQITLAAGTACAKVLAAITDEPVYLKWPNDLYLNKKKVGGILCETGPYDLAEGSFPFAVIGIGLNVHGASSAYPVGINAKLTTLQEQTSATFLLENLLQSLAQEILLSLEQLAQYPDLIMAEWRKYDYLLGKPVVWQHGSITEQGVGLGLLDDGRYCMQDCAGHPKSILSGSLLVQE